MVGTERGAAVRASMMSSDSSPGVGRDGVAMRGREGWESASATMLSLLMVRQMSGEFGDAGKLSLLLVRPGGGDTVKGRN